jgi:tetratricopeptide (TPR) repeat protein
MRLEAEGELRDFDVSTSELDEIFAGLRGGELRAEPSVPGFGLARDYLSKGLFGRALAEVKRVAGAGGDPVEAALLSAEIFRLQGLHGEALDRFGAALEQLGEETGSQRRERAHLGRGWSLLALGKPELVILEATAIREVGGDPFEAGRLEAEARLALGEADAAIEAFSGLLALRPGDPGLLSRIGSAARVAGQSDLARQLLIDALRADPDRMAARIELGELYLSDGLVDDAVEQGRAALEALPGYAEAALLVADGELERGDPDAAIEVLADLLYDDPYNLEALLKLGEMLQASGRDADAIFAFRRVLRFDPGLATAWLRLGEASFSNGEVDDAINCWRRALEAGLDGENARVVEAEIRRHEASVLADARWSA